jgi:hypothetical protein
LTASDEIRWYTVLNLNVLYFKKHCKTLQNNSKGTRSGFKGVVWLEAFATTAYF